MGNLVEACLFLEKCALLITYFCVLLVSGCFWARGPLVFHFLIKRIKRVALQSAQLGASMFEKPPLKWR